MIQHKRSRAGIFCKFAWLGLLLLTTCHNLPPLDPANQGQTPKEAFLSFTHENHKKAFDQYNFDCEGCHEVIDEERSEKLSLSGKASCHLCHIQKPERVKTALKCFNCHLNMKAIQPTNHRTGWPSTHGTKIHLSEIECAQCHSNRSCIRCHSRRDKAAREFHRGSALMTHPIEARTDPVNCQQCHRSSYCNRCHQSGSRQGGEAGRNFHRGPALMTHPREARANSAICLNCHPTSHCSRCH